MKEQVVYKIINLLNGNFYIGSTTDKRERFRAHRAMLRSGRHHCKHLQAAWNKYGEENFDFKAIATADSTKTLQDVEDQYLKANVGEDHCYNKGITANSPWRGGAKEDHPSFGKPKSKETKVKISESIKKLYQEDPTYNPRQGLKHTEETRAKIKANRTPTKGENHYRYGKTLSEEVRKKIGDAQRGVPKAPRTISPEGRAKIKAAAEAGHYNHWQGRTHSEESRAKMSTPIIETTTNTEFPSLRSACAHYGFNMPTLIRALKSGRAILKGQHKGLSFKYLTQHAE